MPEWVNEFEHSAITVDNREAFNTSMEKFQTVNDAAVGYMELQKSAGKPFKMPDSMDKLPDDASRADFRSQAHKLMGTAPIKSIDELADMNFKEGLGDDAVVNQDFVTLFKKWGVESGMTKPALAQMVKFYNGQLADFSGGVQETQAKKALEDKQATITATNEAMKTHLGGADKLEEQTVLLHRALLNNVGATAEEAEGLATFMKEGEGATNAVLRRTLFKVLAPLAAETGSKKAGEGGEPPAQIDPDAGSPSYIALGWSEKASA